VRRTTLAGARRAAALVPAVLLAAGLAWPADVKQAGAKPDPGPVLLLPGAKEPCRLRLEIAVDGQPPAAAWERFLDRLFAHFDTDGDGSLSRAEAARLMPLPLPGGKELVIAFDRLDADGDGKASRAELKAFCRAGGFTPVVVVVAGPAREDVRLADLFRGLDADGDGKLTRAELRRAPKVLRKLDLNEDEYLDMAELLAGAQSTRLPGPARVKRTSASGKDAVLRVALGAKPSAALKGGRADALKLAPVPGGLHRLHGPESWALALRPQRSTVDVRSAGDFLLAQFTEALGDRTALTKADLMEDAALAGFLSLLGYADRNADGKLSLSELQAYLNLVELGMHAQVWVTVTDRDHNPFPFLDRDGDGRLSYHEQVLSADLLGSKKELRDLPSQFELSFGPPAVKTWGGVAIPALKRPAAVPPDLGGAPAWFRAMDRNGDGVISPREFVGPPELFRKLDSDGDGVITPAEAARAGRRRAR
jgi:Ca2+-binding EF-hand superfamily protein